MSSTDPAGIDTYTRVPAQFPSDRARPELLEQRRPGEHVWSAFVVHVLSDQTVKAVLAEQANVIMDGENVAMIMIGCYDIRPTICRVFGAAAGLQCEHGCVPDRVMPHAEVHQVMARVQQISDQEARTP